MTDRLTDTGIIDRSSLQLVHLMLLNNVNAGNMMTQSVTSVPVLNIVARYLLSLSELQVMVGRVRDNWKVSYHKGTSLLHVVDKFSISLQLDRYVVAYVGF